MLRDEQVMRRIKLRELQILGVVVRSGSMAGAAARLAMSQPAVSKAVADLERVVGVRLLNRTARGVEPTKYSRVLLERGAVIFDELAQAVNAIEILKDPSTGELRVGATEPMTAGLVPAVIGRLIRKHPHMAFRVTQSDTDTLLFRELHERSIDVAIARVSEQSAGSDFEVEHLFDERLSILAGACSRWASRRKIALRELIEEQWILPPPHSPAGMAVNEAFAAEGLPRPRAAVESFSIPLRNTLLATGKFVTTIPNSAIVLSPEGSWLKVLPVELATKPRPMGVFSLRHRLRNPLVATFIASARQVAKALKSRR